MYDNEPPSELPPDDGPAEEQEEGLGSEPAPGQDVLTDYDMQEAQAHCPHCLEPISSTDYYCSKCAKPVGSLTGYLPFVNISFHTQFLGGMWRRVWSDQTGWGMKIACAFVLAATCPFIIIIGLPIVLWKQIAKDAAQKHPPL